MRWDRAADIFTAVTRPIWNDPCVARRTATSKRMYQPPSEADRQGSNSEEEKLSTSQLRTYT